MILLFLLLVVVAVGILAIRRQSYFQHREMMSAINPERLAELDAAARAEARKQWVARLGIVGGFIVLALIFWTCSKIPKGFGPDIKIESNEPAPNLDPLKPNPGTFPNSK